MQVRSLGWEDPLEEGMAPHSSMVAWRTPWTEELAGYIVHRVTKSQTQLSDFTHSLTHIHIHTYLHICMRYVLYLVAQSCPTFCDSMD